VTSVNEMTLTFIPKMLAVAVALIFCFPWMMQTLVAFTEQMFMSMNQFIR
jgi:flagellar biosynthetic protein FliQ